MWRPWSDLETPDESVQNVEDGDVTSEENSSPQPKLAGRGVHFTKGHKAVVLSMYKYAKDHGSNSPVSDVVKVLGVARSSVHRVICNDVKSPKKRGIPKDKHNFRRVDEFQWKMIQRTIYDNYAQNKVPSIQSLLEELRAKDPAFDYSARHLNRMVKELGFSFKKLDRRRKIMLSSRILNLRDQFLNRIQQIRNENRPLIFLDETWYDSHDVVKKGWTDESACSSLNTPPSRGKRIIILHAGYDGGWVPGALLIAAKNIKDASADYHQDMDADFFEPWFERQLLPGLTSLFPEKKCAIILDNAPYHSRMLYKTPSMKMNKGEIIEALQRLEIVIPSTVDEPNKKPRKPTKADLLKLYKDAGIPKQHRVDQMAEENGHEVVRLPPYYCAFNPIELIWAALKKEVRRRNTSPSHSAGVIQLLRNVIAEIGEDLWRSCCEHTKNEKKKHQGAPAVEPFIISVEDDEEDSNDEDDLELGCEELD